MLLEITDLDVEFPIRRGAVKAARGVSLTVEPGDAVRRVTIEISVVLEPKS